MKKNLIKSLVALSLVLSVSACNSSTVEVTGAAIAGGDTTTSAETTTETKTEAETTTASETAAETTTEETTAATEAAVEPYENPKAALKDYWSGNSDIDLEKLKGVKELDLNFLKLDGADLSVLSAMTSLEVLWMQDCGLTDISFLSGLTNLKKLDIGNNSVVDISPLSGLVNLTSLSITNNRITDISPLSNLTNITNLLISYNPIGDISPILVLSDLERLSFDGYCSPDISWLPTFKKLRMVELHGAVDDASPLTELKNLEYLFTMGINLTQEQLSKLYESSPGLLYDRM